MTAILNYTYSENRPQFKLPASNLVDEDEVVNDAWERALSTLKQWRDDPSDLEDDADMAPSRSTIQLAQLIAETLRAKGSLPPTRVMANGEAGIAFEWTAGVLRRLWEIDEHHIVEMSTYNKGRRLARNRADLSGMSL